MAIVDRSTVLGASADVVWEAVKTPAAFRAVTRGMLSMPVVRARTDLWREGETVIGWVFLFGIVPFSRHRLQVARVDDSLRTLSSREFGGVIAMWNHDIEIEPIDAVSCRYRDLVEIRAGFFTPLIVVYAKWFYRMRQRRWRALAKELQK